MGRAVADGLGLPLDIVIASQIGAPRNPERAVGAVASDGSVWFDEDAITALGVDAAYLERERRREAATARAKAESYRLGPPAVEGRTVLVVDDGVATGAMALAAIRLVRESGARRVVIAVPVVSPRAVADLEWEADAVLTLAAPRNFLAVGQFYERFDQVGDEEAKALLRRAGDVSGR